MANAIAPRASLGQVVPVELSLRLREIRRNTGKDLLWTAGRCWPAITAGYADCRYVDYSDRLPGLFLQDGERLRWLGPQEMQTLMALPAFSIKPQATARRLAGNAITGTMAARGI